MKGAAAMSVEMCAVDRDQQRRGGPRRARPQRAACLQVGAGAEISAATTSLLRMVRSISTPHQPISAISATNSAAQAQR